MESSRVVGGKQVSVPLTNRLAKVKRQENFLPISRINKVSGPQKCALHSTPNSMFPFVTRLKSQVNPDCGVESPFLHLGEEDDSSCASLDKLP